MSGRGAGRDAARRAAARRAAARATIPAPRDAEPPSAAQPATPATPAAPATTVERARPKQSAAAAEPTRTVKATKPVALTKAAKPARRAGAAAPGKPAAAALGKTAAAAPPLAGRPDASLPVDRSPASAVRAGWHLRPGGLALAAAVPAAAGGAAVLTGGAYLAWRVGHLAGTGLTGAVCFAAEVAAFLALAVLAVQSARVNRRFERRAPGPAGSLDVFVVTRGEPLGHVDHTLRSARDLAYPHRTYLVADPRVTDPWVDGAGRHGARALEALAERLDVTCLWHAAGPPQRPALLNAALAETDAEAVLLLDAGDSVVPDAAHQLLGYLRDPHVGLVTSGWRAAAGAGPLPDRAEPTLACLRAAARDRDGAAAGVGSGTLYRRAALETVDGFSDRGGTEEPRTSYELHAAGWTSVHHPAALVARATRPPATAARLQVVRAVDRLRILLFDNPLRKHGLDRRQRAHYLWDAAAPVLSAAQAGMWLGPALVVLGGGRVAAGASVTGWLGFGVPYLATAALFCLAVTATGGAGLGGVGVALAGWLASIPLSVLAVARVVLLGGRSDGAGAPDVAPAVLTPPPLPAPDAAPIAARGGKAGARRPRLPGWPRLADRSPSRSSGWRAAGTRVAAEGWTPLLPVPLAAAGLGLAVLVAVVRPDRGLLGAVVWAGVVLLAAAEPVAAACGIPWDTPTHRRRLRATLAAGTLLAVLITLVLG